MSQWNLIHMSIQRSGEKSGKAFTVAGSVEEEKSSVFTQRQTMLAASCASGEAHNASVNVTLLSWRMPSIGLPASETKSM